MSKEPRRLQVCPKELKRAEMRMWLKRWWRSWMKKTRIKQIPPKKWAAFIEIWTIKRCMKDCSKLTQRLRVPHTPMTGVKCSGSTLLGDYGTSYWIALVWVVSSLTGERVYLYSKCPYIAEVLYFFFGDG